MIRSRNEIGGMVHKAARGAGWPLGLAEDVAAAMDFCADPVPALRAIAGHLAQGPAEVLGTITTLDALQAGLIGQADLPNDPILQALAQMRSHTAAAVTLDHPHQMLRLHSPPAAEPAKPATGAVEVDDDLWSMLASFAAKTFVPATEASRIAGAGAGLSDND